MTVAVYLPVALQPPSGYLPDENVPGGRVVSFNPKSGHRTCTILGSNVPTTFNLGAGYVGQLLAVSYRQGNVPSALNLGPSIVGNEAASYIATNIAGAQDVLLLICLDGFNWTLLALAQGAYTPQSASVTSFSMSVSGVTGDTAFGILPAGAYILYAFFRETQGAGGVNVAIGSTPGGSDVMSAIPVPALGVNQGSIEGTTAAFNIISFVGITVQPQALYLHSSNWNGATLNCQLVYQIGP